MNPLKPLLLLFLLLIILFHSVLIYAQVNAPKQITNFDFDSRNPVFLEYPLNLPFNYELPELFFEAVTDSLTSVCSIKYNAVSDSFYQLTYISSNSNPNSSIINRYAQGKYIDFFLGLDYKILIWETNQNENWDIAFSIDSGNGWTPQSLLFSSLENETEPSFVINHFVYIPNTLFEIIYLQGNSVALFSKGETEKTEILFQGSDSVNYSSPTGAYPLFNNKLYVVAVEEKNGKTPRLVYRYRSLGDTLWSDKKYVIENTPAMRPKFTDPDFETILSFEDYSDELKKNLLIRPADFGIPGTAFSLIEDSTIETSDFSAFSYYLITESSQDDYYPFTPFAFKFRRNDSTFIRTGEFENYYYSYSDNYTRLINSKPAIGPLSEVAGGTVSYTIWEDSSNNKINLFGIKRVDYLGTVENNSWSVAKFTLSQNYPNPFNPTTTVNYQIPELSFVTLKVYDVLGNEIATLVNEEKPAGSYEVDFSGNNLTSGIYFYQLQAGEFIETKKMILLK
jgi:hypothetical protein